MAMIQQKHHARFHAAVLRTIFPEPSSLPAAPSDSSQSVIPNFIQEEDELQVVGPTEEIEKPHVDSEDEDLSISKPHLSRAQRKRLKLKKLKENRLWANQTGGISERTRRFIGPLLPELQPDSQKEPRDSGYCDQEVSVSGSDSVHEDNNILKYSQISVEKLEEEETTSDDDPGHKECSSPLSRAKRRRLATKKKQTLTENWPRDSAGLPFTAEVQGTDFIIKRVS